jgi:hypothetical protein
MKIITGDEVFERINLENAYARILVADAQYVLPTARAFHGVFAGGLAGFLAALKMGEYIPEKGDCDDFALAGEFFAKLMHRRNEKAPNTGIAVGTWWYARAAPKGTHAVNFAILSGMRLAFLEPQTQTPLQLTKKEIESCYAVTV